MTEKEIAGKKRLLDAMHQFDLTYPDGFPESEELFAPSREYLRTIRRLSRSLDGARGSAHVFAWKRAMMIAITSAAVLFSAVSLSATASGKSISAYIATLYEHFAEIIFGEEQIVSAPENIDAVYSLSYFPRHYYIEGADIGVMTSQIIWRNREGDKLILHQGLLSSHELMIYGESQFETITVNGNSVMRFERGGQVFFFWTEHGYAFELSGSGVIPREEYTRMIESLRVSSYSCYRTDAWWEMYRNAYYGNEEE